eukprot:3073848-Prorocentrum_lima.AAC.1
MDVPDQCPAAQLRGVFRIVVLEAIVHQAGTGTSLECALQPGKPGGSQPSPEVGQGLAAGCCQT